MKGAFGSDKNFQQLLTNEAANFARIAGQLAIYSLANSFQYLLNGADTKVRRDQ